MTDTTVATVELNPIKVAFHDLGTMLEGKSTFNQFAADEAATIKADIAKLPAAVQGIANTSLASFEAGASVLVGAGQTMIGPILAEATDTQATQVQNLLSMVGINPGAGPLSAAEHAALVTLINGLKAGLDRVGLKITTSAGVKAN